MADVPEWLQYGACRIGGYPTELFDAPARAVDEDKAIAICQTCEHETTCLLWAIDREKTAARGGPVERFHIYGGTRPVERTQIARLIADNETGGGDERTVIDRWRAGR